MTISFPALVGGLSAVAALSLGLGFWAGVEWQLGRNAKATAKVVAREQPVADKGALQHAKTIRSLNKQLEDANAKLRSFADGRDCLTGSAVGVLNDIQLPGAASGAAPAPGATATDQDVGDALAVCRSKYAAVADQLNKILIIEDKRHGPVAE